LTLTKNPGFRSATIKKCAVFLQANQTIHEIIRCQYQKDKQMPAGRRDARQLLTGSGQSAIAA